MKYFSLKNKNTLVSFREATMQGQAPDRGLYFPEHIPQFRPEWLRNIEQIPDEEIAFQVMRPYVEDEVPEAELRRIAQETVDFPIPLVPVTEHISSLELFHGPTLAFKDVGARFMSRCLGYFSRDAKTKVTVLVATSGDTGSAVANGFYEVPGVEVVILYPSGRVSRVQEQQLTTLGRNIHTLEVAGSFDDCQQLVKQAFADADLTEKLSLTSANSINVARWLPQQIYYLLAWKQWKNKEQAPVISVPSGNFGNICAGLLAQASGLPVHHFIAACNANDVVPEFMKSQEYKPKRAVSTLSNAMDVGDPSNFVRILELFHHEFPALNTHLSAVSIPDSETREVMLRIYREHGYLLDPHGAVGFLALERYLKSRPGEKGIFLETAHPVKFFDVVEPVTGEKIPVPDAVQAVLHQEKKAVQIGAQYADLQGFLTSLAV